MCMNITNIDRYRYTYKYVSFPLMFIKLGFKAIYLK